MRPLLVDDRVMSRCGEFARLPVVSRYGGGGVGPVKRRAGGAGGVKKLKVKFSHTRYRALGPELIPVYRQSARR